MSTCNRRRHTQALGCLHRRWIPKQIARRPHGDGHGRPSIRTVSTRSGGLSRDWHARRWPREGLLATINSARWHGERWCPRWKRISTRIDVGRLNPDWILRWVDALGILRTNERTRARWRLLPCCLRAGKVDANRLADPVGERWLEEAERSAARRRQGQRHRRGQTRRSWGEGGVNGPLGRCAVTRWRKRREPASMSCSR